MKSDDFKIHGFVLVQGKQWIRRDWGDVRNGETSC